MENSLIHVHTARLGFCCTTKFILYNVHTRTLTRTLWLHECALFVWVCNVHKCIWTERQMWVFRIISPSYENVKMNFYEFNQPNTNKQIQAKTTAHLVSTIRDLRQTMEVYSCFSFTLCSFKQMMVFFCYVICTFLRTCILFRKYQSYSKAGRSKTVEREKCLKFTEWTWCRSVPFLLNFTLIIYKITILMFEFNK